MRWFKWWKQWLKLVGHSTYGKQYHVNCAASAPQFLSLPACGPLGWQERAGRLLFHYAAALAALGRWQLAGSGGGRGGAPSPCPFCQAPAASWWSLVMLQNMLGNQRGWQEALMKEGRQGGQVYSGGRGSGTAGACTHTGKTVGTVRGWGSRKGVGQANKQAHGSRSWGQTHVGAGRVSVKRNGQNWCHQQGAVRRRL